MDTQVGSEEGQPPHLYVGNLSARVTTSMLGEIFSVCGPVAGVKLHPDRHGLRGGLSYAFVEYADLASAEGALALDGRVVFDIAIRVNWARRAAPIQAGKEDTQGRYHVFVGDLAPEINDAALRQAFAAFQSLAEARVMWDISSGKSRGYGFASFTDRADAEQSIATMNGEWLGSRTIRVNWANQKLNRSQPPPSRPPLAFPSAGVTYEQALVMAPHNVSTVYCGNLAPFVTQQDLLPLLAPFGYIVEVRMQPDRGYAFVKLDSHEHAASAIASLAMGTCSIHGRPLKVSWGKERELSATAAAVSMRAHQMPPYPSNPPPTSAPPTDFSQMYGVQPASSFGYASFAFPTPTVHVPRP